MRSFKILRKMIYFLTFIFVIGTVVPATCFAFVFDFAEGIINDFYFSNPTELFSYDDSNGNIRITKPADSISGSEVKYAKMYSNFLVGGDFEISIDYKLNSAQTDGDQLEFQIYNSGFSFFNVRSNEGWIGGNNYHVFFNGNISPQPGISTTDNEGSLKITRTGDQITAYYKSIGASEYSEIYSYTANSDAVRVVLSVQNQPHSNSSLDATFDNLRINCERFIYPRSADTDEDGVIDEWDNCPDTEENSVVFCIWR